MHLSSQYWCVIVGLDARREAPTRHIFGPVLTHDSKSRRKIGGVGQQYRRPR